MTLTCFSPGRLGHAQVFACTRTALSEFSPDSRAQPAQEGFTALAPVYRTGFVRQDGLSLSQAAAPLVQTKRGCQRLVVNELLMAHSLAATLEASRPYQVAPGRRV